MTPPRRMTRCTDLLKKEYDHHAGIPQSALHSMAGEHDETNRSTSTPDHEHERQADHYGCWTRRAPGPFALCKIGLVTGCTHQIRAHGHLGKPVLGDIKYELQDENERTDEDAAPRAVRTSGCAGEKHPCTTSPARSSN
ncbi:hypothetical protein ACKXF4_10205 [Faecalibacterium prausnitzii]|uniref:hypothetical protein n=1 Tax=Faecalibacterium prausnitzii TaxID=853 RepID=UPI003AAC5753